MDSLSRCCGKRQKQPRNELESREGVCDFRRRIFIACNTPSESRVLPWASFTLYKMWMLCLLLKWSVRHNGCLLYYIMRNDDLRNSWRNAARISTNHSPTVPQWSLWDHETNRRPYYNSLLHTYIHTQAYGSRTAVIRSSTLESSCCFTRSTLLRGRLATQPSAVSAMHMHCTIEVFETSQVSDLYIEIYPNTQ